MCTGGFFPILKCYVSIDGEVTWIEANLNRVYCLKANHVSFIDYSLQERSDVDLLSSHFTHIRSPPVDMRVCQITECDSSTMHIFRF